MSDTKVPFPNPTLHAGQRLVVSGYARAQVADYGDKRAAERDAFWQREAASAPPTQGAEGAAPQAVVGAPLVSLDYPDYLRRDEWDAAVERKQRDLEQRTYRVDPPTGRLAESDQRWKALADVGPEGKGRGFLVNGWHVPAGLVTVFEAPESATATQTVVGEASEQISLAHLEAYRHVANEWADMAINGWQHAHNLADGISEVASVRDNMDACLAHCRKVNKETFAKFPMPALTPSPTPTAPQEADALREAAQVAIDVLDHYMHGGSEFRKPAVRAINALSAALAQHQPTTLRETK